MIFTIANKKIQILTPADFAKLAELRLQAGLDKLTGKKIDKPSNANEDSVTADAIQSGNLKRGKASKEARLATVLEGRKDREKYGSRKGNIDKPHSTTNKEKARKKNFLMTLGTAKRKQRMSLVDKKKVLQAHVKKQKMKKK